MDRTQWRVSTLSVMSSRWHCGLSTERQNALAGLCPQYHHYGMGKGGKIPASTWIIGASIIVAAAVLGVLLRSDGSTDPFASRGTQSASGVIQSLGQGSCSEAVARGLFVSVDSVLVRVTTENGDVIAESTTGPMAAVGTTNNVIVPECLFESEFFVTLPTAEEYRFEFSPGPSYECEAQFSEQELRTSGFRVELALHEVCSSPTSGETSDEGSFAADSDPLIELSIAKAVEEIDPEARERYESAEPGDAGRCTYGVALWMDRYVANEATDEEMVAAGFSQGEIFHASLEAPIPVEGDPLTREDALAKARGIVEFCSP